MNIRTLWYFLSAVTSLGVAAGARRINIAQSTMSSALSALEGELGSSLFVRTHIGLQPTATALRLRDYALWLVTEAEQAFLDMKTGSLEPLDPLQIYSCGIPRCSVADWSIVSGLFGSLADGGQKAAFVAIDDVAPNEAMLDGIVIRYHLVASPPPASIASHVVRDDWSLVFLRETANVEGQVSWDDLSKLRLIVPPTMRQLEDTLAESDQGLKVDVVPMNEAGAPYTLLDHKDAALLLPSSSLPDCFAETTLRVLPVFGAPVVPALSVTATGEPSPAKQRLARFIAEKLLLNVEGRVPVAPHVQLLEERIDLHTFRCFQATMETGNTARASQICFIVQPALSGQIRKLEKALSRDLFNRSYAGMSPTPSGRRLSNLIEPILSDHATVLERLRNGQEGSHRRRLVRVGIVPAANEDSLIAEAAARALSRWRNEFENTPISVAEGYTSVLLRWLRTHLIDLVIIDTTENQPGLHVEPIFSEPISLVFAPGSVWDTGEEQIEARLLSTKHLVMPSKRFGLRAIFDRALAAENITITPRLEVDSLAIALQLVRRGDWATILPPSAVGRQLHSGRLKSRMLVNPSLERRICSARRARAILDFETEAMLRELDRAFKALLPEVIST